MSEAQEKLDALRALTDEEVLEKAWEEVRRLCGATPHRRKDWTMHIPVDADRDSDIIIGEALIRLERCIRSALSSPAPAPKEEE